MSLAVIGLFVLWLGWFGFNPGSTMSFENPTDVMHILMTTNTSAIAAVLTSTITSWIAMGKPDLGMTINGCLAGLVGVTGGCAYVSIESSLIIGAVSGILVVFLVMLFDKLKIDDPVGATSVHLGCGVFGTICVGLFAEEGVTSLSTTNGLFFGGGFSLLGKQLIGIVAVGAFTFVTTAIVWLVLKKTVGIRVSREEELQSVISANTATWLIPISFPLRRIIQSLAPAKRKPSLQLPAKTRLLKRRLRSFTTKRPAQRSPRSPLLQIKASSANWKRRSASLA